MRWERDTSELMQSVTAQHLPSTGFLPLDLSHLCLCLPTAIFQGFVTGHICQQSCGRNIEKEQCTLAPLSSSCSPPVLLTNRQTLMPKTTGLIPTREVTGKIPWASADFVPQDQKPVNPTHTGGGEEPRHSPTAPQKLQPNKEALSTARQGHHENCFTTQESCLGRIVGNFRLVQDSWASGRPGEADLCALLPNCFMLQSSGPPWRCKSRSVAPVLPVTPTALSGINLIALEPYSSFRLKHKVWYTLKSSDLVHMCNLPADQTSPGRSMFFCTWFLGQEIPGRNIGALITVKTDK